MNKRNGLPTLLVCLIAGFVVCLAPLAGRAGDIAIPFGDDAPGQWRAKVFRGETRYTVTDSDGVPAMRADSRGTASGLVHEVAVDLNETPCLNWSWKVSSALEGLDETTKAGDDFPARVYVIVSGGLFFWNTRALNYVWSGSHPSGSAWANPYTDRCSGRGWERGLTARFPG